MVADRFQANHEGGEVTFTCSRFPNRIENKRYVQYIMESLLAEAKRLVAEELPKYPRNNDSAIKKTEQQTEQQVACEEIVN